MVATAAAIAGMIGTGVSVGTSLFGGKGTNQRTDIMEQQLADARQAQLAAQIAGAQTSRLGRAGYSDSMGGGYEYDPATNTWTTKLGPEAQAAQSAADRASIERHTTDMRQAQGANARADRNAVAAQQMIDAARRRFGDFRPMDAEGLTADLTSRAVDANNQAYTPARQDLLRTITRTGSGGGDLLARQGEAQAGDLRKAMLDARIQALGSVDQINNSRRQGLASDLQTATAAGTPNFQYTNITPRTDNKDMLAALTTRANSAGYTSALGQQGVQGANKQAQDAATGYAGSIPKDPSWLSNLYSGSQQITNMFKDKDFTNTVGSWFGDDKKDAVAQAKNDLINS